MGIAAKIMTITTALGGILRHPLRIQYAALPYRHMDGKLEFMLITSRETARWIVPKGWPRRDGEAILSVLEEAWEEAGLRGKVFPDSVGSYIYDKNMQGGYKVHCKVIVFAMAVESVVDEYPEAGSRKRMWVSAEEAASRVVEPDLAAMFFKLRADLAG